MRWPLVWRKTMETLLNQAHGRYTDERRRLVQEIQDTKESVYRIANRCSMIRWFRQGDVYEIRLRIDPRAFGTGYRQDQELMAEVIAHKIQAQLASSEFIKAAQDEESRHL